MQIICPHCGFTKEIDASKLPAGAKSATCPKCRQKFELNPSRPAQASAPPPLSMEQSPEPPRQQPAAASSAPPPPMPATPAYQEPGFVATPPPPLPGQMGYGQSGPTVDIPWESRGGSFFGDYFATVKMVLFKPGDFFGSLPVDAGIGKPLVFAIINGVIGFFFSVLWQMLFMMVGVGLSGEMTDMAAVMGGGIVGILAAVILFPIFFIIGLFIGAAVIHLFLLIVRGGDSGYQATFRTMAYVSPTYLFGIVPFLGSMVGGIWALILMIIGLAKMHRTGIGRVIIAVIVIPIVLTILLAILGGILVAVFAR